MNYRTLIAFCLSLFCATAVFASATLGTIDPSNTGDYKAQILNTGLGSATTINFGKFTTQSSKNITVSNTELRGFAFGDGVGWIVMNCADTTSGCSSTNGNFKVVNTSGVLSGYAWGETTGWVNFGPFSNSSTPQVKITNGSFAGTTGTVGYAWAQNFGWIKFDCASASSCVKTDWTGSSGSGGGGGGGGSQTQCSDLVDNDLDGLIDEADPGCHSDGNAANAASYRPNHDSEVNAQQDFCTVNPSDPSCSFCALNPTDPSCVQQPFCTTHPTDPSCSFCAQNPSAPACQLPFCTTNPSDPSCQVPFCIANPTDPSCVQQPFCTTHPSDPSCSFCALHPTDASCITPPPAYCTIHPEACFPPQNPTKVQIALGIIKKLAEGIVGKVVTTAGIVAASIAAVLPILFANPFSLYDIYLILARLWSLLLAFLGFKRKARPWGTVYDSIAKQPLDPVYVVLTDITGNVIATSITDIDGRYGFSVPAGTYRIMANKTNYEFPSKKLAGKTEDELYNDLYFGGDIVVTEDGGIIAKNIPLDQLNFDWNEYAKVEQHRLRFYHRRDVLIARITTIFFIAGFILATIGILASASLYNIIIFSLYALLTIAKILGIKAFPRGSVADKATGQVLPFSIVRVISNATNTEVLHKVADRTGKYYCLVGNGNYRVVVERKNADQTYTPYNLPETVEVKKGYLKSNFEV